MAAEPKPKCSVCYDTGIVAMVNASVPCPRCSGDTRRVDAAFKGMFRKPTAEGAEKDDRNCQQFAPCTIEDIAKAELDRRKRTGVKHTPEDFLEKAARFAAEQAKLDSKHLGEMMRDPHYLDNVKTVGYGETGQQQAPSGFRENLSEIIDLETSRRDINPNGVHVAVGDRLVALETEDLNVSFEEQQKFDLPPQVTVLTKFEAEVMGQLLMNELSPDGNIPADVVHYWIDVFQFMGKDYFDTLKKLVAKLEWTV